MLPCAAPTVHLHLVDFFILQRDNNPDAPVIDTDPAELDPALIAALPPRGLFEYERNTPKDVLFLGPSQEIWVIARWEVEEALKHACRQQQLQRQLYRSPPPLLHETPTWLPAVRDTDCRCAALLTPACRFGAHRGDYMWVNTVGYV